MYLLLQYWDLKDIFDQLKALCSPKTLSPKIRFMILDVIDLNKDKWLPKCLDSKPVDINEIKDVSNAGDNCFKRKYFERYL